jgi:hypothetical protein
MYGEGGRHERPFSKSAVVLDLDGRPLIGRAADRPFSSPDNDPDRPVSRYNRRCGEGTAIAINNGGRCFEKEKNPNVAMPHAWTGLDAMP